MATQPLYTARDKYVDNVSISCFTAKMPLINPIIVRLQLSAAGRITAFSL